MASTTSTLTISLLIIIISTTLTSVSAQPPSECQTEISGECYNKAESLKLKLIAIPTILIASMIGVCLPLFTRSVPALHPDRALFAIVKAFSSGVILATGYMHVLPDSFDNLSSPCLAEKPWHTFPFTGFVAMLSAVATLMVDSLAMSFYRRVSGTGRAVAEVVDHEMTPAHGVDEHRHEHAHAHGHGLAMSAVEEAGKDGVDADTLRRYRVIAQVLELGIVVHSVVIGLSMGASMNPCTIRPLVAALCFHQLFEGMGLGGCILQAEYRTKMKAILVFFFSTTTPFGIALGLGLSKVYSDNSPTALIVVGLLNASSAGLLNYMALVDLLAADFMGPKLQSNVKLQLWAYVAVLLGAGGMSLMAKWA
ncbi:Fe(2+) transport protein 2 [Acorus gramineus]|uniref:Fe(2+) transport protein 2 n=1 Tax=Acorus gramineus TaxID=55184 RepID=A0AAV9BTW6_ACOGR|nr:Fe(2+) transport protein 2 [Acorus gramineus]